MSAVPNPKRCSRRPRPPSGSFRRPSLPDGARWRRLLCTLSHQGWRMPSKRGSRPMSAVPNPKRCSRRPRPPSGSFRRPSLPDGARWRRLLCTLSHQGWRMPSKRGSRPMSAVPNPKRCSRRPRPPSESFRRPSLPDGARWRRLLCTLSSRVGRTVLTILPPQTILTVLTLFAAATPPARTCSERRRLRHDGCQPLALQHVVELHDILSLGRF